jgi:DNA-binding PadR family transcriptional regulator
MHRPPTPHEARRHRRPPHGPGDIPFGVRGMFRRGGWGRERIRRGEIRPLVLSVLATRPMHGYEVMQELETRSGGRWRPSAGSVYPTLQLLSDEGLVTSEEIDGRRVYSLTEQGRAAAAANPAPSPWDERGVDGEDDLRRLGAQLMGAVMQVHEVGTQRARRETTRILTDARRQIYRLLAEDEIEPTDGATAEPDGTDQAAGADVDTMS